MRPAMNRKGRRASSRRTKPKKLIRPPRASAARSAVGAPCARRFGQCAAPQLAPQPTSTSSGTSRVSAGSAALAMTSRITRRRLPPRARRALRTPVRHGPGAACAPRRARPSSSASSMRAIARLMRSALVPWIGALIAARSAPARCLGLPARMLGKWVLRPNRVRVKPLVADERQRLVDIGADAREALEIAGDDRLALFPGHAQPAGQAPGRNAVEDGEIDRLGLVAGVAVDRPEQFLGGQVVDVLRRRANASLSCGTSAMCAASRSSIWL